MLARTDLTGKRFGRLVVLNHAGKASDGKGQWECLCDCGTTKIIKHRSLVHDGIIGCGCKKKPVHGFSNSPTYISWECMKSRCNRSKRHAGRGITVCDRWKNSFQNFIEDMGERPEGCIIDRIDNNGNYEPGNCRWTTHTVNNNNRENSVTITFNGETKSLLEWSKITGINSRTLRDRIKIMPISEALTKPVGRWK